MQLIRNFFFFVDSSKMSFNDSTSELTGIVILFDCSSRRGPESVFGPDTANRAGDTIDRRLVQNCDDRRANMRSSRSAHSGESGDQAAATTAVRR